MQPGELITEECVEFTCPNLLATHNYGDEACGYYLVWNANTKAKELTVKEDYTQCMREAWYGTHPSWCPASELHFHKGNTSGKCVHCGQPTTNW